MPTVKANWPAIVLIGANNGIEPSLAVTVSYAIPVTPVSINFFEFSISPARCKYVKRVKSSLKKLYSSGVGSFTFTIISEDL